MTDLEDKLNSMLAMTQEIQRCIMRAAISKRMSRENYHFLYSNTTVLNKHVGDLEAMVKPK